MALVRAKIEGWKVHPPGLYGNPDFVFPILKVVIFVDGCFWHGCPLCGHLPETRRAFWEAKIAKNRQRDVLVTRQLRREGYSVARFWEHTLRRDIDASIASLTKVLKGRKVLRARLKK